MPNKLNREYYHINYEEINPNAKVNVVLLHGLGANSNSWEFQLSEFKSKNFRIIVPDLPGFGKSTINDHRKLDIHVISDTMADFIYTIKAIPTILVGISMGGTIALQLALDYPSYVSRLVLINTFASLNITSPLILPYLLYRFALINIFGLKRQGQTVANHLFPYPEQNKLREELIREIEQADPRVYKQMMIALSKFNVSNRLSEINIPTLVITGKNDTTVPSNAQKELADSINNSKQITIPNAGHAITVEAPETINSILLDFITSN
jgi:pimeloyl-ACP methyl ester carboxylesterase